MDPTGSIPDNSPGASDREALPLPSRRHYELHPPGMLYLVITVFLAIGSVNSQNNLLFLAFGLAIAGFLLSGLISGPPLMKIHARRHAPHAGAVGEHAELRYTITNHSRWLGAMGLEVREITDRKRGGALLATALSNGSPGGVLNLKPAGVATATVRATPARRGVHRLVGFTISTTFPFGLFRKTLVFDQPDAWIVTPRRVPLRPMPWHRSGRDGATLSATASRRGQSTEFYALRQYTPGDPSRQIAWLPSARLGELVVREQAASAPPKLWLRIDSPPDTTPEHLVERAAALVASLAQDASKAGFSVGLRGSGLGRMRPLAGPKQVRAIQTQMAALGHEDEGPIEEPDDAPSRTSALRVTIQYQRKGRSAGRGEFSLSAEDVRQWFAGSEIPPEFEPHVHPTLADRAGATRDLATGWLADRLGMSRETPTAGALS